MINYKFISEGNSVVAKIDDDGKSRMSCMVNHPEYLQWVADGGVATPYVKPLNESREELYQSANAEWVTRSATLLNLKVRGSSPEQALTARTMREVQRNGPNADAIATLHDKLDTLKDLIEAAVDQADLDIINVSDNTHWA
jgi:hypothetical protein